jgi:AcrR family transcriptional regulator
VAVPNSAATPSSRRDEHKRRTRAALRDAALDLFSSQGFDATTTEELAERAGVAVRTFFRYFPTKESVLYIGESEWIQGVVTVLADQPLEVTDLEALRASILSMTSPLSHGRPRLQLYSKAVASSPTLRGRELDYRRANGATLARAVAARHGLAEPDRRSAIAANIALLTYREALDAWLTGPEDIDLRAVIAGEFDLLEAVVGGG